MSFALFAEDGGFSTLVDLSSSKQFVDPALTRGVESRMIEYARIEPFMEIRAAGANVSHGTA